MLFGARGLQQSLRHQLLAPKPTFEKESDEISKRRQKLGLLTLLQLMIHCDFSLSTYLLRFSKSIQDRQGGSVGEKALAVGT